MEPLSLIVTAVVTGAVSGLGATAAQVVKDAYAALRQRIIQRYGDQGDVAEAVEKVETRQDAEWPKEMLREELEAAGAMDDRDLLEAAQALIRVARPDRGVTITAQDHSVAIDGSVGGSVTNVHTEGEEKEPDSD